MKKLLTIALIFLCSLTFGQSQYIIYSGDSVVYHGDSVATITLDADAVKYITAVENADGVLTIDQILNVDWTFRALKYNHYWDSIQALYLMIGGNAASCAINAKDTSAFRLTFYNVVPINFDHDGWTANGSSYVNTSFIPSTSIININRQHLAVFIKTNVTGERMYDVGVGDVSGRQAIISQWDDGTYSAYMSNVLTFMSAPNANTIGFYLLSRTTSTYAKFCKNENIIGELIGVGGLGALPSLPICYGAFNNNGSPFRFSTRKYAYFSIGAGIDNCPTYNKIVQRFVANK